MAEWRPAPGKVAVLEPEAPGRGRDVLTGVVVSASGGVRIDLGASPPLEGPAEDVVASFFEPDALYRVHARAVAVAGTNLVDLEVRATERVQRRQEPRVRLRCPVTIGGGEASTLDAETVDLAGHGARLATDRPLPAGADATLLIRVPGQPDVRVEARVLEVVEAGDHWEERVRFLDGDAVDLALG